MVSKCVEICVAMSLDDITSEGLKTIEGVVQNCRRSSVGSFCVVSGQRHAPKPFPPELRIGSLSPGKSRTDTYAKLIVYMLIAKRNCQGSPKAQAPWQYQASTPIVSASIKRLRNASRCGNSADTGYAPLSESYINNAIVIVGRIL